MSESSSTLSITYCTLTCFRTIEITEHCKTSQVHVFYRPWDVNCRQCIHCGPVILRRQCPPLRSGSNSIQRQYLYCGPDTTQLSKDCQHLEHSCYNMSAVAHLEPEICGKGRLNPISAKSVIEAFYYCSRWNLL